MDSLSTIRVTGFLFLLTQKKKKKHPHVAPALAPPCHVPSQACCDADHAALQKADQQLEPQWRPCWAVCNACAWQLAVVTVCSAASSHGNSNSGMPEPALHSPSSLRLRCSAHIQLSYMWPAMPSGHIPGQTGLLLVGPHHDVHSNDAAEHL